MTNILRFLWYFFTTCYEISERFLRTSWRDFIGVSECFLMPFLLFLQDFSKIIQGFHKIFWVLYVVFLSIFLGRSEEPCIMCHLSYFMCHVSPVIYQVCSVRCHLYFCKFNEDKIEFKKWWSLFVEGLLSTGHTPSS